MLTKSLPERINASLTQTGVGLRDVSKAALGNAILVQKAAPGQSQPLVGKVKGWVICITGGATEILLEELRPVLSSSALITLQTSAPGRGAAPSSERARKTASKRWKPGLPAGWLCGPCRRKPTATGC